MIIQSIRAVQKPLSNNEPDYDSREKRLNVAAAILLTEVAMAYKRKYIMRLWIGIIWVATLIPPSTGSDCGGKPFRCLDATQFIICVDLGNGVSSTIDSFVVPCPEGTECRDTNHYECEVPPSTTTASPLQSDVMNATIVVNYIANETSLTTESLISEEPEIYVHNATFETTVATVEQTITTSEPTNEVNTLPPSGQDKIENLPLSRTTENNGFVTLGVPSEIINIPPVASTSRTVKLSVNGQVDILPLHSENEHKNSLLISTTGTTEYPVNEAYFTTTENVVNSTDISLNGQSIISIEGISDTGIIYYTTPFYENMDSATALSETPSLLVDEPFTQPEIFVTDRINESFDEADKVDNFDLTLIDGLKAENTQFAITTGQTTQDYLKVPPPSFNEDNITDNLPDIFLNKTSDLLSQVLTESTYNFNSTLNNQSELLINETTNSKKDFKEVIKTNVTSVPNINETTADTNNFDKAVLGNSSQILPDVIFEESLNKIINTTTDYEVITEHYKVSVEIPNLIRNENPKEDSFQKEINITGSQTELIVTNSPAEEIITRPNNTFNTAKPKTTLDILVFTETPMVFTDEKNSTGEKYLYNPILTTEEIFSTTTKENKDNDVNETLFALQSDSLNDESNKSEVIVSTEKPNTDPMKPMETFILTTENSNLFVENNHTNKNPAREEIVTTTVENTEMLAIDKLPATQSETLNTQLNISQADLMQNTATISHLETVSVSYNSSSHGAFHNTTYADQNPNVDPKENMTQVMITSMNVNAEVSISLVENKTVADVSKVNIVFNTDQSKRNALKPNYTMNETKLEVNYVSSMNYSKTVDEPVVMNLTLPKPINISSTYENVLISNDTVTVNAENNKLLSIENKVLKEDSTVHRVEATERAVTRTTLETKSDFAVAVAKQSQTIETPKEILIKNVNLQNDSNIKDIEKFETISPLKNFYKAEKADALTLHDNTSNPTVNLLPKALNIPNKETIPRKDQNIELNSSKPPNIVLDTRATTVNKPLERHGNENISGTNTNVYSLQELNNSYRNDSYQAQYNKISHVNNETQIIESKPRSNVQENINSSNLSFDIVPHIFPDTHLNPYDGFASESTYEQGTTMPIVSRKTINNVFNTNINKSALLTPSILTQVEKPNFNLANKGMILAATDNNTILVADSNNNNVLMNNGSIDYEASPEHVQIKEIKIKYTPTTNPVTKSNNVSYESVTSHDVLRNKVAPQVTETTSKNKTTNKAESEQIQQTHDHVNGSYNKVMKQDSVQPSITINNMNMMSENEYDELDRLVTKKMNLPETEQPIDCKLLNRGRYSDKNDCRKFYICVGHVGPIHGLCPQNTVFSEFKKQCTRNLSHCIRDKQFQCITTGRFSDHFNDNVYYICARNNLGSFVRFKLQCNRGYYLDKENIKCTPKITTTLESQSVSSDDMSTKSDSVFEVQTRVKSKKQNVESVSREFKCDKEGKFPISGECRKYYECYRRHSKLRRKRRKCDSDEIFHKDKKKCVDADSYECEYS